MLDRIASNGVRSIIAESPDRFVRDLTVQLTGHDFLKSLGVSLIPATAPDFFTEDTPTAVLVRQVLGAIAQFSEDITDGAIPPPACGAHEAVEEALIANGGIPIGAFWLRGSRALRTAEKVFEGL